MQGHNWANHQIEREIQGDLDRLIASRQVSLQVAAETPIPLPGSPPKTSNATPPHTRPQSHPYPSQQESRFLRSPPDHWSEPQATGIQDETSRPSLYWPGAIESEGSFEFLQLEKPQGGGLDGLAGRMVYEGAGSPSAKDPFPVDTRQLAQRPSTADDPMFPNSGHRDLAALFSTTSTPLLTPSQSPLRPRTSESHISSREGSGGRVVSAQRAPAPQGVDLQQFHGYHKTPASRPGTSSGMSASKVGGKPRVSRAKSAPPVKLVWKEGVGLVEENAFAQHFAPKKLNWPPPAYNQPVSKETKISLKQEQFARTGSVVTHSTDKRRYPVFVRLANSTETCAHRFPPRPLGNALVTKCLGVSQRLVYSADTTHRHSCSLPLPHLRYTGGEWQLVDLLQKELKPKVKPTSARSDVILNRYEKYTGERARERERASERAGEREREEREREREGETEREREERDGKRFTRRHNGC